MHRLLTASLVLLFATLASAAGYDTQFTRAVGKCQSIDEDAYQSGLFFNPDGYRSYYERSKCFKQAAIKFKAQHLCREVKRRHSFFSSSWGYSESQCNKEVEEAIEKDRLMLEEKRAAYLKKPVRLIDFRVERNGNGRDIDIIPTFTDGFEHPYQLSFEIRDKQSHSKYQEIDRSGFYLKGSENNIRIFVYQADIKKKLPAFSFDKSYQVRAILTLSLGNGGYNSMRSDAFNESVFPSRQRTQVMEKEVHL